MEWKTLVLVIGGRPMAMKRWSSLILAAGKSESRRDVSALYSVIGLLLETALAKREVSTLSWRFLYELFNVYPRRVIGKANLGNYLSETLSCTTYSSWRYNVPAYGYSC